MATSDVNKLEPWAPLRLYIIKQPRNKHLGSLQEFSTVDNAAASAVEKWYSSSGIRAYRTNRALPKMAHQGCAVPYRPMCFPHTISIVWVYVLNMDETGSCGPELLHNLSIAGEREIRCRGGNKNNSGKERRSEVQPELNEISGGGRRSEAPGLSWQPGIVDGRRGGNWQGGWEPGVPP
ncbi:hypothetical protein J6590_017590 [Homalodisca vitripennis]|nr:hypothetical protein J6590_017590 [Homalodisca vitripennis]